MHDHADLASQTDQQAEVRAALSFLLIEGVGSGRLRRLREAFGSWCAALRESPESVAEALRCDPSHAARVLVDARGAKADEEIAAVAAHGARIVLSGDSEYPALLAAGVDAPELLAVRGALDSPPELAVAIVGSRRASAYGRMQAARLAVELAERSVTIVSGGARGIDAEAHRGAMRAGGRTIAVLATGVARPYPPEHEELFDAIVAAGGATITEQPSFIAARPELFPRRNRIIAGLSLVTVVVEAANRSGALLTARLAVDDYGRDAACVPGPVDSVSSQGCHRAIREGWAQLVTGADDVCEMLAESRSILEGAAERQRSSLRAGARPPLVERKHPRTPRPAPAPAAPSTADMGLPPDSDAASVLGAIRELRSAGLDELERALGWEVPRLAAATLLLEMRGAVRRGAEGAFELSAVRGGAR